MRNFNIRKIFFFGLLPLVLLITGTLLFPFSSKTEMYNDLELFSEILNLVETKYVEEVDSEPLMKGAFKGLLEGVDRYSSYLSDRDFVETKKTVVKGYSGISAVKTGDYAMASGIRQRSPAYAAGLRQGEFIRSVNGISTRDMTLFQTNNLLESPPGTKLELVMWKNDFSEKTYEITTVTQPIFGIIREKHPEGIVFRIEGFFDGLASQLLELSVSSSFGSKLVLDMRGCFSGDINEAVKAADIFLNEGVVAIIERGKSRETVNADSSKADWTGDIIILTDSSTAGASEIFISSMVDGGRAKVIGEKSFGKGLFQEFISLKNGSALYFSTTEALRRDGSPIEGKGIEPDFAAADDPETPADEVIIKAYEVSYKDIKS